MANIDFSNAQLSLRSGGYDPWPSPYLAFGTSSSLRNSNGNVISNDVVCTRLSQTLNKVSYSYSGTMNYGRGGTDIMIEQMWLVTNINYSSGDSYNFIIDIDLTVG